MNRILSLIGFFGALLLPLAAFGADGDACKSHDGVEIEGWTRGPWIPLKCVQVCDGKVAADDDDDGTPECADYDFGAGPGMPDVIVLEYDVDNVAAGGEHSCSSTPDITVTTGPIALGGVDDDYPEYSPDTTAVVLNSTTDRVLINTELAHLDRYLFFELEDAAACANGGIDIRMFLYNRKNRP
jgi:hypothetical protein